MLPTIDQIIENFDLIEDWEERYNYIIELGRDLPPLPSELHTEANRVHGCESQVWLDFRVADAERLALRGDSDSMIVRGFVALVIALYDGKTVADAAATDGLALFRKLDFGAHVTSKRANGIRAMIERIQRDSRNVRAPAPAAQEAPPV